MTVRKRRLLIDLLVGNRVPVSGRFPRSYGRLLSVIPSEAEGSAVCFGLKVPTH
jgi:hypothetical protein